MKPQNLLFAAVLALSSFLAVIAISPLLPAPSAEALPLLRVKFVWADTGKPIRGSLHVAVHAQLADGQVREWEDVIKLRSGTISRYVLLFPDLPGARAAMKLTLTTQGGKTVWERELKNLPLDRQSEITRWVEGLADARLTVRVPRS